MNSNGLSAERRAQLNEWRKKKQDLPPKPIALVVEKARQNQAAGKSQTRAELN